MPVPHLLSIKLSDIIITDVHIKDGFWGVAKVDGWRSVGDGTVVGEVGYSGYPYIQEAIKES